MRLTNYTNYALRTLMYAALAHPRLVRVQDVADAYGISRTHLVKCVHNLGIWGFLINQRGRNGGFRLARPAAEIRVADVVRHTEDGFASPRAPAAEGTVECLIDAVERARTAFLDVLDGYTVADITENRCELRCLLGFEEAA